MVDAGRARRMSARIKQIVASTLESQIKDPRLGMVTITDVRLTGDLHDATMFYTVFGDAEARAGIGSGPRVGHRASCAARSVGAPAFGSPRRWRSSSTSCPSPPIRSTSCSNGRPGPTPRCSRPGSARCRPASPTRTGNPREDDDE